MAFQTEAIVWSLPASACAIIAIPDGGAPVENHLQGVVNQLVPECNEAHLRATGCGYILDDSCDSLNFEGGSSLIGADTPNGLQVLRGKVLVAVSLEGFIESLLRNRDLLLRR